MPGNTGRQLTPGILLKKISSTINEFLTELLVAFSLLIISLLLIYFLIHFVIPEKKNAIDSYAFLFFRPIISSDHTQIARFITFFGTGSFLIPCYIIIVYNLVRKNYIKYAMMVSTMVVSSLLLGWLLKAVFHRSRPPYPLVEGAGGYSFPSGHALGGFIFCGILLFLIWKTRNNYYTKWLLSSLIIAFGICIGLSRIYLHVHYATDIIGSFFVTLAWFSLSYIFFRIIYKHEMFVSIELNEAETDLNSGNYFSPN
ncbi:MAG TPA: phosphatase PAP2 family protein [Puia sp.]|jgi:undecaprenyl-diphosphatase|nr:phosphatase PAP2 family protein [Puia sp.]